MTAWLAGWRSRNSNSVARLVSGTALAQVIALVVTPISARLYTPAAYGALALYASAVLILGSVATGRYDAAVVLPAHDEDGEQQAIALVKLALTAAGVFSVLCFLGIAVGRAFGFDPWLEELHGWAYLIPVAVFTTSVAATLIAYANRARAYSRIAVIQPLARALSGTVQITWGLLRLGSAGLLVAAFLTPFVGIGRLSRTFIEGCRATGVPVVSLPLRSMRGLACRYSDFLRFNAAMSLLSALAWNVQVVLLSLNYPAIVVGQYSLAFTVVTIPATIVMGSVNQVYVRELSDHVENRSAALALSRSVVRRLLLLSVIPFALLGLTAPWLLPAFLGPQWTLAGSLAQAMVPVLWCRFVSTSMVQTFTVYRAQGRLLLWQLGILACTVLVYLGCGRVGWEVTTTVWVASLVIGPAYLFLIPWARRVISSSSGRVD